VPPLQTRRFPLSRVHTFFCSPFGFADVSKGSPPFPAGFFLLGFVPIYEYLGRIWLCDSRGVLLVLYKRDLGVGIFPGVRRTGFLSAISIRC